MVTFPIVLPTYLRQWLVFTTGSEKEIFFPKGSPFNAFLRVYLRHKRERESFAPADQDAVNIVIPKFPGKDPMYHNYLPEKARQAFVNLIRDWFDVELFRSMSLFDKNCTPKRRQEFLLLWMEENGIDPDDRNFCAVNKRLQLLRQRAFDRSRKKRAYASRKVIKSLSI